MDVALERARVATAAERWLRTPFHHGARLLGVGVDCGQLVLAIYEEAGVLPPIAPAHYPPSFGATATGDAFIRAIAADTCVEVDVPELGDVVAFGLGRARTHLGIVTAAAGPHLVHAHPTRGVVCERFARTDAFAGRIVGGWSPRRWHPEPAGVAACR